MVPGIAMHHLAQSCMEVARVVALGSDKIAYLSSADVAVAGYCEMACQDNMKLHSKIPEIQSHGVLLQVDTSAPVGGIPHRDWQRMDGLSGVQHKEQLLFVLIHTQVVVFHLEECYLRHMGSNLACNAGILSGYYY